jgi:hypothetical protein
MTGSGVPYQNPAAKVGRPVRFRRDRLTEIDAAASQPGRDGSQFIRYGADLMLGSIRCGRCDERVPLRFGDVDGKDMWDWMQAAQQAAERQHPAGRQPVPGGHTPVLVGAETAAQDSASSGTAEDAATKEKDAGVRTEPPATEPAETRKAAPQRERGEAANALAYETEAYFAGAVSTPAATVQHLASKVEEIAPGTVLFQQPGSGRVVTAEVPQPGDHSGKRGRAKPKCTHITSGGRCKICEPRGNS